MTIDLLLKLGAGAKSKLSGGGAVPPVPASSGAVVTPAMLFLKQDIL